MAWQKPRQIAVNILRRHEEKVRFLEKIIDHELSAAKISAVDRGLLFELVYGVTRWRDTLDWLIGQKAKNQLPHGVLLILLRLGLYQIFWLDRIPDHAAVHETVELARQFGLQSKTGFVNAILREYLRDKEATQKQLALFKETQPALGYSHPEWLCQRWRQRWDEKQLRQLLEWNNTPAKTYARLNTLLSHPEKLLAQWESEGVKFEPCSRDWVEDGMVYQIDPPWPLADLESFKQGGFYVQDPSTLLAVRFLDPQPKESVLDFCAAPGGKTTFIAQLMNNEGYIMAQDLDIHRRLAIRDNCQRLGVTLVNISRATTSINFDLSEPFDRVLVDVPCSNTGVIRRRVDLRWRITPEEVGRLVEEQKHLLLCASRQVKKDGMIVYSTCSLEPEENQEVVHQFLKEYPQFELEEERALIPFVDGVDGAYAAKLVLKGEPPPLEIEIPELDWDDIKIP